jgi:hypothetical protein
LGEPGRVGVMSPRYGSSGCVEATGNSDAIANLLTPIVGLVVVSNPSKTRAMAEAKVKTDSASGHH